MNDTAGDRDIDLLAMILILWRNKIKITLWAVCCLLIGFCYIFFAPKKFSSYAELTTPTVVELGDYLNAKEKIMRIMKRVDLGLDETKEIVGDREAPRSDLYKVVSDQLFDTFILALRSDDLRRQFFVRSKYNGGEQKGSDKQITSAQQNRLQQLAQNISITNQDEHHNQLVKLNYVDNRAEVAQQTLEQYLTEVNRIAFDDDKTALLLLAKQAKAKIRSQMQEMEEVLSASRVNQIKSLSNALAIAQKSELVHADAIINPSVLLFGGTERMPARIAANDASATNSQMWLFLLGERFLQAQKDVLTAAEISYPTSYYVLQYTEQELEKVIDEVSSLDVVPFYRVLSSPSFPFVPDRLPDWIIMFLSLVLGLFLGAIFVLFDNALKNHAIK